MNRTLTLLLIHCSLTSIGQSLWTPFNEQKIPATAERRIVPLKYAAMALDQGLLFSILEDVPERFSTEAGQKQVILRLPTPDGRITRFRLEESPLFPPEEQAEKSHIRCFTGYGIDDPTARVKCDYTPWGFHAMIRSAKHSTIFIDPYSHGDTEHYIVYYKKDFSSDKWVDCRLDSTTKTIDKIDKISQLEQGDCKLRRYDLALACTGEYAQFHGGTVPLVEAAMATSMNRVNGVYETDFGVTMIFVANNDTLIFLNGATDPYSNGNGVAMLTQNQNTCTARIGAANYDIGHVFSTGGGGVATLACVCSNTIKARGVTGSPNPVGDPFDIDYVAHEMGHQFNGNHTQNNDCNRVSGKSMEPGSASTIMGYAGICNPNVQSNSDAYFHAINLQETHSFLTGSGNGCATQINTSNSLPTVNAGADYTIPKSTPFILTATGSDPNGDPLTYCWEQMDPEWTTQPPVSTSTTGPKFRSLDPVDSPLRYFPRYDDVLSGANGNTWEVLTSVQASLDFRVTVRDNNAAYGCTEEDDMILVVSGTSGPFEVTSPNTAVTWTGGTAQTVTWSVNNTNVAPVNCANVKISISFDGGQSWIVLAASTPNDGSQSVTIPNTGSTTCRIKIECATGNIFYDVSNANFTITGAAPVELSAFTVEKMGKNSAQLRWTTASETENRGFEIEARGGIYTQYTPLAFVDAKGDGKSTAQYEYLASNLPEGLYYFRLKQIDLNGRFQYSPVRAVSIEAESGVKIQPNPVRADLRLVFVSSKETLAAFTLLDAFGRTVLSRPALEIVKGSNSILLDVRGLAGGAYYYIMEIDGKREEGKVIISQGE